MRIWKFELEITDVQEIQMPGWAQILSVGNQGGKLCLWAAVDPDNAIKVRVIEIVGTGHELATGMGVRKAFIGTVIIDPFVWHVFERLN